MYGTHKDNSDYDYIVINKTINNQEIKHPIVNIHLYTMEHFKEMIKEHKIQFMEIYSNNDFDFQLNIDLSELRKEISSKSNNSWVKCKKKLNVEENEYNIGIKSLFHSIRIIDFGIQIAQYGKIKDFSSMNYLWDEISKRYWTWDDLKETYQSLYNGKMSEFRKLAPKS